MDDRINWCFPSLELYRVSFLDVLHELLIKRRIELVVYCGSRGFHETSVTTKVAYDRAWFNPMRETYLFGNRFLWMPIPKSVLDERHTLIVPLNPRILNSWLALVWRRMRGRGTYVYGHAFSRSGAESSRNFLRRIMMRLSDGVIVYTLSEETILKALVGKPVGATGNSGVFRAECFVASTPVDERTSIIYSGRLIKQKKVDVLVRAFAMLSDLNVNLTIVGSGPEEGYLKALVADLGCGGRVEFVGAVWDSGKLSELYSTAFCSVSPGYVGLACIQSFARGIPMIIARDEAHAPEIEACKEGDNCLFFDSNDPRDLGKKLRLCYNEREVWGARYLDIAAFIRENYTVESMADNTVKFLLS